MTGAGGMGAFGGGNFAANPAAAAALMTAGGFNPAAFAGFGAGAMGNFAPGFGFNGMGFGGFPFFSGFGGFGPGGFGAGVGGGGVGVGSAGGASGYGAGGGYSGVAPSGRGHSSSSSYDKADNYGELPYGMGDMKGASPAERNPSVSVLPGASGTASASSTGYEGMTNPMAAAYGSYTGFPGGFGGFPATMGDWSQFAAAAAAGGASGGGGVGGVATSGDYQIGNYSQLSSNYGPTSRVNSRSVIGADKNNRGYRPY